MLDLNVFGSSLYFASAALFHQDVRDLENESDRLKIQNHYYEPLKEVLLSYEPKVFDEDKSLTDVVAQVFNNLAFNGRISYLLNEGGLDDIQLSDYIHFISIFGRADLLNGTFAESIELFKEFDAKMREVVDLDIEEFLKSE